MADVACSTLHSWQINRVLKQIKKGTRKQRQRAKLELNSLRKTRKYFLKSCPKFNEWKRYKNKNEDDWNKEQDDLIKELKKLKKELKNKK